MGAFVDWAAVVLPTLLAGVGVWVSIETPQLKSNASRFRWRSGLIVFGIFVSVITWVQQRNSRADLAETQSALRDVKGGLNSIADAMKLDRNSSAQALAEEIIKRLDPLKEGLDTQKKRLDELAKPQVDMLYQDGRPIARVAGMSFNQDETILYFQNVTSERRVDFSKEMKLQNNPMICSSAEGPTGIAQNGAVQTFTYYDVSCRHPANRR